LIIELTTAAKDVDGWDSLAHIRLVVAIERALDMRFSASEISDLENVGEMCELIISKSQTS
jgi:acyl carrier protein